MFKSTKKLLDQLWHNSHVTQDCVKNNRFVFIANTILKRSIIEDVTTSLALSGS